MGPGEMLGDVSVWFDLGYFLAARDSCTEVLTRTKMETAFAAHNRAAQVGAWTL